MNGVRLSRSQNDSLPFFVCVLRNRRISKRRVSGVNLFYKIHHYQKLPLKLIIVINRTICAKIFPALEKGRHFCILKWNYRILLS